MSTHDPSRLDAIARPGYSESFVHQEVRWRAAGGLWEITPEGVRTAPGRMASWFVCRAVRPPVPVDISVELSARDVSAGDTAAAAVSILTDQGHRSVSAVVDVKARRLVLFGAGTQVIAHAPLPSSVHADQPHLLGLSVNGPEVEARLDTLAVRGRLRRTIRGGLLAFWTDPGVEAVYRQVWVRRAFHDTEPFDGLPPDWSPEEGEWESRESGVRLASPSGTLVKRVGTWEDVEVEIRPIVALGGASGIGLRGSSSGLLLSVDETRVQMLVEGPGVAHTALWERSLRDGQSLMMRRIGSRAWVFLDGESLGALDVPPEPGELVVRATGRSGFHRVRAVEWL